MIRRYLIYTSRTDDKHPFPPLQVSYVSFFPGWQTDTFLLLPIYENRDNFTQWQRKHSNRGGIKTTSTWNVIFLYVAWLLHRSLRASSSGYSDGGATTSLEFEHVHRKSSCEMLIGGDDISDDVITLGACFSMFVYKRRSFPLRTDWRKSDSSVGGEPQGNWRWNSNSRDVVASSPSFSLSNARAPRRACSQASNFVVTGTSLC